MVRPTVSARSRQNAPSPMDNGMSVLCPEPTKSRAMCGTISPKKLIGPMIAVEMDARSTATHDTKMRVRSTFTPIERAVWSDSAKRSQRFHTQSASTSPTAA